jgi:predicted small lipoprotein YifL
MIRRNRLSAIFSVFAALCLLMTLTGCGGKDKPPMASVPSAAQEPVSVDEPAVQADTVAEAVIAAEPAESSSAAEIIPERQNGDRFEDTIILEGMEEVVHYEHIRNDAIGFEMDYDYENFVRQTDSDRESFVSNWDDPNHPENYLEVKSSPLDAEAAAASIAETLSQTYDIGRDDAFQLARAGRCIRIDASADVGGQTMPDHLQMVYILPASDGCRIATAHYAIEGSEGYGRRFGYLMNTFSVIPCQRTP